MTPTPEQIAAGLSKAQRCVMIGRRNTLSALATTRAEKALARLGLIGLDGLGMADFTPLGLAVAAIIRSENDGL